MNSITKKLKQEILSFETVEERLNHLKGKFQNKKAVIVATGPTLSNHVDDLKLLHDRDDIVLLSVKQGYNYLKGQSDFHIMNTYNFDKYKGYDYEHMNTIIFYGLSKSYVPEQIEKLAIKPHPCDIWVPIVNPPFTTYEECAHMGHYDKMLMLQDEPQSWWGTSILWEQAVPMALLLGCKDITTIGWDNTTGKHVFDHKDVNYAIDSGQGVNEKRVADVTKYSHHLHDFFIKNNIEMKILSKVNPCDSRIKRIKNIKEI